MPPITRAAWRDALRGSGLPPATRAVANALAAYWPNGTARPVLWATLDQLSDDTGYSRRHVSRALTGLQDTGYLVLVERARQHRAPRYFPTTPGADDATQDTTGTPGPSTPQGGHPVHPEPVDNPSQGGHHVHPDGTPRVDIYDAQGGHPVYRPIDPEEKTPLPPSRPQPDDTTAGDIRRGGYPSHIHETNAARALAALAADCRLPLTADELLEHAYRRGDGNPWAGYERIKPACLMTLDGARDPRAVLLARLRSA